MHQQRTAATLGKMPMPTHINGRPVKTGQWTDAEDALLAEWQGKLGNRCTPPPIPWMSRACTRMVPPLDCQQRVGSGWLRWIALLVKCCSEVGELRNPLRSPPEL